MIDLSLVPMEELIDEIERRHKYYIIGVCRYEEGNQPIVRTYWPINNWVNCVGLASIVLNDVITKYDCPNDDDEEDTTQ